MVVKKKKAAKVEAVDLEEEKLQMLLGNWKLHLLKTKKKISLAGVFQTQHGKRCQIFI